MTLPPEVRKLNDLLGSELPRNEAGDPRYMWAWSEDLVHLMKTGNFDEQQTPAGLWVRMERLTPRKMLPMLKDQWVMMVFQENPDRDTQWQFGRSYYAPLSPCYLKRGLAPTADLTWFLIYAVRDTQNTKKDWERMFAEEDAKRLSSEKSTLTDEIRDEFTTYDHVPGRRDQVSYPTQVTL